MVITPKVKFKHLKWVKHYKTKFFEITNYVARFFTKLTTVCGGGVKFPKITIKVTEFIFQIQLETWHPPIWEIFRFTVTTTKMTCKIRIKKLAPNLNSEMKNWKIIQLKRMRRERFNSAGNSTHIISFTWKSFSWVFKG